MYKIIAVGKIKETYLKDAIAEYQKRLLGFNKLAIYEVAEVNHGDLNRNIQKEGENILERIGKDDWVITLEITGQMLSSLELAEQLDKWATYGKSNLTFIIGGSYGLSKDVLNRSDFSLSFSKMTFPHQLMRVFLLEQIYRAFTINKKIEYHK